MLYNSAGDADYVLVLVNRSADSLPVRHLPIPAACIAPGWPMSVVSSHHSVSWTDKLTNNPARVQTFFRACTGSCPCRSSASGVSTRGESAWIVPSRFRRCQEFSTRQLHFTRASRSWTKAYRFSRNPLYPDRVTDKHQVCDACWKFGGRRPHSTCETAADATMTHVVRARTYLGRYIPMREDDLDLDFQGCCNLGHAPKIERRQSYRWTLQWITP